MSKGIARRGTIRSIVSAMAFLAVAFACMAAVPSKAFAATSIKGYTIGTANVPVYSSSSLTGRIGAVYPTDEFTFNSISANGTATNVTYPISGGRTKTGWVQTSAVLTATSGEVHVSTGRYTTYRRPNGPTYGSVYAGDNVLVLGTKDGYTQIRYPVSGGYKAAWAKTSTVNAYMPSSSPSPAPQPTPQPTPTPTTTTVQRRLDQIASGALRYNSSTNMRLGTKFTGTRASEQCKGFAKNVFYLCFKVMPNSTQSKPNNHLLNSKSGMSRVGYYSDITTNQAKSLFSKARPGDFVQMRRRSSGGSHSAIVYSVSSSGITFFEANTDGRNTVMKNTYTWAQLSSRNRGMSLYTASNYNLR